AGAPSRAVARGGRATEVTQRGEPHGLSPFTGRRLEGSGDGEGAALELATGTGPFAPPIFRPEMKKGEGLAWWAEAHERGKEVQTAGPGDSEPAERKVSLALPNPVKGGSLHRQVSRRGPNLRPFREASPRRAPPPGRGPKAPRPGTGRIASRQDGPR